MISMSRKLAVSTNKLFLSIYLFILTTVQVPNLALTSQEMDNSVLRTSLELGSLKWDYKFHNRTKNSLMKTTQHVY